MTSKKTVTSAYAYELEVNGNLRRLIEIKLIQIRNRVGAKIDPCGSPKEIDLGSE